MNTLMTVLDELEPTKEERKEILATAERIRPEHGMRNTLFGSAPTLVERAGGSPERLEELLDELPDVSPFGFRPLTDATAIMFMTAHLSAPEAEGAMGAMNGLVNSLDDIVDSLPMLNVMRRTVAGNLTDYYRISTNAHRNFWNFGSQELEILKQGRVRIYIRDLYPGITRYFLLPYHRAVLSVFDRSGEVTQTDADDSFMEIEIRFD